MTMSDMISELDFFTSAIQAGAILAGFCGTFLAFRIQREAEFYRTPEKSYKQQWFSIAFILIIFGTLVSVIFGVVFPLLKLANICPSISPSVVVGGFFAAIILIAGYFLVELLHYHLFDRFDREWQREVPVAGITIFLAAVSILWGIF